MPAREAREAAGSMGRILVLGELQRAKQLVHCRRHVCRLHLLDNAACLDHNHLGDVDNCECPLFAPFKTFSA